MAGNAVFKSVTIGMISVVAMVVVEAALVIMEVMPIVIFANVGFAAMNAIAVIAASVGVVVVIVVIVVIAMVSVSVHVLS